MNTSIADMAYQVMSYPVNPQNPFDDRDTGNQQYIDEVNMRASVCQHHHYVLIYLDNETQTSDYVFHGPAEQGKNVNVLARSPQRSFRA